MSFSSIVGSTYSVYMSSGLGKQLEHFIEPQMVALRHWAARHTRQGAILRLSGTAVELDPEISISIEEDPASMQNWVVRPYSLSAEPIEGLPEFGWDDLEPHSEA